MPSRRAAAETSTPLCGTVLETAYRYGTTGDRQGDALDMVLLLRRF
jgi:hypothetical protein